MLYFYMNGIQITAIVMAGIIFVALLVQSIFLINGKGAVLIAGYNTLPQEEKDRFDKRALCQFSGCMLLLINALVTGMVICIALYEFVIAVVCGVALMIVVFSMVVYVNASKRFINQEVVKRVTPEPQPEIKEEKPKTTRARKPKPKIEE